jgi:uncharacterized RDD family membrane protein YckC
MREQKGREAARLDVSGHYAGAVSRAAAAALDIGIAIGAFTLGLAGIDLLSRVLIGRSVVSQSGPIWIAAYASWLFLYVFVGLAVAGRTPGKGIIGLRVVTTEGMTLPVRRAFWRTLAFPLSIILLGLGFVTIIFQREHRALHDMIAKTAVVYDWGDRAAELPGPLSDFLSRQAGAEYTSRLTTRQ